MTEQLLFIDNKAMDINESTNITLNFRSNIFSDVSKITSNNTYSIKLPLTVNNCHVINYAHLPSHSAQYARLNHKGRYLRNGIEIIPDASVILIEISETIDIAMTWGNVSKFAEIVNDNKTLQDLSYGRTENEDYIIWKKGDNSPRIPKIDYGFKNDEPAAWYHPVVTAMWVLNKIEADADITFKFQEQHYELLKTLVIPLLSRNSAPKEIEARTTTLTNDGISPYNIPGGWILKIFQFVESGSNYYVAITKDSSGKVIGFKPQKENVPLRIIGTINIIVNTSQEPQSSGEYGVSFDIRNKESITSKLKFRCNPSISLLQENQYRYSFAIDGEFNPGDTEELSAILYDPYAELGNYTIEEGSYVKITMRDTVYLKDTDEANSRFYYVPNLPDIKQIDFIKAIASICGTFAIPGNGNIVSFVPIDTIIENKTKALNWTKRVIASYSANRPKNISFKIDGFSQRNVYKWKNDDKNKYNGIIYVDDKTLEYEQETLTLPFAASEMKGGIATIPIYSYTSDGALQYNESTDPRLLVLKNDNTATFDGLDWNTIIENNYKSYQKYIREPKIITELVEIRDHELRNLDMSVPVYLAQYGKYYAVISIKAEKTGICECKLFQLD